MNPIVLYFAKVSGAMVLFYLCYKLFLSNDTYFNRNRFYFLGGMVIAIAVPFIKITVRTIEVQPVPQFAEPFPTQIITQNIAEKSSIWPDVLTILLIIYLLGVTFFIIRMILAYTQAIRIIGRSERSKFYELVLALTAQAVVPFSMFKWLVIPKNTTNQSDFENIVQHESIHSRQFHSVDLLLAEIITAFQWFNPFVWMMKRAIIENHEYIVDKTLLTNGVDAREYQYSLLSYVTAGSGQLAVANHFNVNLLKKRISMMNRNKSPQWHALKNGLILLSLTIVVAFSATFETKVIAQSSGNEPEIIINGKKSDQGTMQKIGYDNIQSINVTKNGQNDVIEVTTQDTLISQNADIKNGIKVYEYREKEKSHVVVYAQKRDTTVMPENMDEVEVIGYGRQKDIIDGTFKTDEVKVVGYTINSKPKTVSILFKDKDKEPLILLDGKKITYDEMIRNRRYLPYQIIEGKEAVVQYGEEAKYGVLLVRTIEKPINFNGGLTFRSKNPNEHPLIVVNGKIVTDMDIKKIDPSTVKSVEVLKAESTLAQYGDKAKDGVIIVTLKDQKVVNTEYRLLFAPNPASDDVTVTLDGSTFSNKLDVKMYNKFGALVLQDKKSGPVFTVSVGSLLNDVYIMIVTDGDKVYKGNLSVVH